MSALPLGTVVIRIEAEPEPTRELFEAAYVACFGPVEIGSENWFRWRWFQTFCLAEAWTDAAMLLVPGGWAASVLALPNTSQRVNGARGVVTLYEGAALSQTRCLMPEIEAATPALALAIAALKARAAREAP